jgi:phosphatidylserine decarboxylase
MSIWRRALTRVLGVAATVPIPRALRRPVLGTLARRFGCDLGEADRALEDYPSFQAFFTRRLRDGARAIDDAPLVSPADGEVTSRGTVERGRLMQVKGIDYSVADLLGDEREASAFEGGEQVTIYLHPRNYHRVHAPVDGTVTASCHMPGTLRPVHERASRAVPELFARNERLVTTLDASGTRVAVVMVAAMGCGHVRAAYDPSAWRRTGPFRYPQPIPIRRGDEIGTFAMGSTVVLLVSTGGPHLEPLAPGATLCMGAALSRAEAALAAAENHG